MYSCHQDEKQIDVSFAYDEEGHLLRLTAKHEDYDDEEELEYEYDEDGNLQPIEDSDYTFEYDRYGNITAIEADGKRYEYEYQKMKVSSDCLWNGNDIAIIRQADLTMYMPWGIPGWHHASVIYNLGSH